MGLIKSYTLPIVTVSEGNAHEHWRVSHARHKKQKQLVNHYLSELSVYKGKAITVKLIRISSGKLDAHDNLRMSQKFVVDAIADILNPGKAAGRADDTDLIQWEYDQEKGKPKEKGIRVEIYAS